MTEEQKESADNEAHWFYIAVAVGRMSLEEALDTICVSPKIRAGLEAWLASSDYDGQVLSLDDVRVYAFSKLDLDFRDHVLERFHWYLAERPCIPPRRQIDS